MKKRSRARVWISLVLITGIALFGAGLVGRWYLFERPLPFQSDRVELRVPAGSSVRSIAQAAQAAGIEVNADAMVAAARLTGTAQSLRAGRYAIDRGITLGGLLAKLRAGDVVRERLTVVEGITFRELRALLAAQTQLKQDAARMSDEELLKAIGASETHPEGLFAPETYVYDPGTSDLDIYRQAYRAQTRLLQDAWAARKSDLPYSQSVRSTDDGVDHRKGNRAGLRASDDCRSFRQSIEAGHVAANRSLGHLRNRAFVRRQLAQARSACRRALQLVYARRIAADADRAARASIDRSGVAIQPIRRRCTSCRVATAPHSSRRHWRNIIGRSTPISGVAADERTRPFYNVRGHRWVGQEHAHRYSRRHAARSRRDATADARAGRNTVG